tara:strand:+ start:1334 stop:1564 length:231 start_codon:yes stop_codon:yes gene_type:complete
MPPAVELPMKNKKTDMPKLLFKVMKYLMITFVLMMIALVSGVPSFGILPYAVPFVLLIVLVLGVALVHILAGAEDK